MLMLDLNLHAKVIHTQNVGNGIGLMATQIVNDVADAKVAQFLGGRLYGLIPSLSIIEVVFYPQLFTRHLGVIIGWREKTPTIFHLFQFQMLASGYILYFS